jgi:acyl-CoA hydrolase
LNAIAEPFIGQLVILQVIGMQAHGNLILTVQNGHQKLLSEHHDILLVEVAKIINQVFNEGLLEVLVPYNETLHDLE